MLVFDTADVPVRERADAVCSAMLDTTLTTSAVHHDPNRVHLRIHTYRLGRVELTRVATSGVDTTRTSRQTGSDEEPVVALSLGMTHAGVIEQDGRAVDARPGEVNLVELTRAYFSRIPHGTDGWSVKIPLADLAVPEYAVTRARAPLATDPVHRLFARHLGALGAAAEGLDAEVAALLGTATVALARALIYSAAGRDDQQTREAMADSLVLRVRDFVREHLCDPAVGPAEIAAAHHVSVRHLYKVLAAADTSLEQWIIGERLDAARRDLQEHGVRRRTIAATARRWGFADASHFSRRFRERFGMTPGEWVEQAAVQPGTTTVQRQHVEDAARVRPSLHDADT